MDLSALPVTRALSSQGLAAVRWAPELPCALHTEIFAGSGEGSGAAAALALARRHMAAHRGHILWVQDAQSRRLTGRPYRPGLPADLRDRVIHVGVRKPEDALFALEEGMRCRDLACVIGEIAGNPRVFDFTASRRLSLMAEKHGVPLFLVRLEAERDLSSARMRWEIASAPSIPPPWNPAAPGWPGWRAELFRSRTHAPGQWILRDDGQDLTIDRCPAAASDHGDLAGATGARSVAAN